MVERKREVLEAPEEIVPKVSVILNIRPVTDSLERAEEFYHRLLGLESNHDVLGVEVKTGTAFLADARHMDPFGLPGAQHRESTVAFPEKTPQLHFFEFKGVDRKPLHPHLQLVERPAP